MENTGEETQAKKWYDHIWVVALLLFFIMPIGLYALWKNNFLSKDWKIGGTLFALLMVSFSIKDARNAPNTPTYTFNDQIEDDIKTQMTSGICDSIPFGATISNLKIGQITEIEGMNMTDVSVEFDYSIYGVKKHHASALLLSLIHI